MRSWRFKSLLNFEKSECGAELPADKAHCRASQPHWSPRVKINAAICYIFILITLAVFTPSVKQLLLSN